ncbi:MAG: CPBP family intramembrane metalloprotease [Paracoccaceae bacterium]|nr:CPBP family intramembrane metalloprotease [Paracoccaceae bacterium]
MTRTAVQIRPLWLWAEFAVLFAGVPVAMTVFFGLYPLFPVLFAFTVLAMGLLAVTPGGQKGEFFRGPVLSQWRLILGFTLLSAILTFTLALILVPDRILGLPRYRPEFWFRIMLLYPILSALPQEIIYRVLFFRRYGHLFPSPQVALCVNALAFSMAHSFYQNPVAIGLTLLSGLVFAWAYQRHRSLMLCTVMHAIAGLIMFASGLGVYFYHGAIGQTP